MLFDVSCFQELVNEYDHEKVRSASIQKVKSRVMMVSYVSEKVKLEKDICVSSAANDSSTSKTKIAATFWPLPFLILMPDDRNPTSCPFFVVIFPFKARTSTETVDGLSTSRRKIAFIGSWHTSVSTPNNLKFNVERKDSS